jgi:hypothetical protein
MVPAGDHDRPRRREKRSDADAEILDETGDHRETRDGLLVEQRQRSMTCGGVAGVPLGQLAGARQEGQTLHFGPRRRSAEGVARAGLQPGIEVVVGMGLEAPHERALARAGGVAHAVGEMPDDPTGDGLDAGGAPSTGAQGDATPRHVTKPEARQIVRIRHRDNPDRSTRDYGRAAREAGAVAG